MLRDGLYQLITTTPAITAILGTTSTRSDKTTGVFPMLAIPEAVFPYVTFYCISGEPVYSLKGANKLHFARFRFSCFAASQRAAVLLSEQFKLLFATYSGTLPDGTQVQDASHEMEMDDAEPQTHGTIYATHVDFTFSYVDNNGA
jgi:hypothetical protein